MKHLELHIIQSVPVSCLNRDDLGSPKTAVFGGVQRARVSSQSWKRAIREMAKEMSPAVFNGNRTRLMVAQFVKRFMVQDIEKGSAVVVAEYIASVVETLDSKKDNEGYIKIKTLMFFSPLEYDAIASAVPREVWSVAKEIDELRAQNSDQDAKKLKKQIDEKTKAFEKISKKVIENAVNSVQLKDAADIALFGRMVANDPSLTLEAAAMFSHALSVHKVDNEIDFFAAVDDLQPDSEVGGGHLGTLEFNSATYYRFAAVNLDMLADAAHLGAMTLEERKSVVETFVKATIEAVPGARRATMNSNTMPIRVLGVVRETGHPIQLINAFEKPLYSKEGYAEKAKVALNEEYKNLKDTWGVSAVFEKAIPDVSLKTFLEEICKHVI